MVKEIVHESYRPNQQRRTDQIIARKDVPKLLDALAEAQADRDAAKRAYRTLELRVYELEEQEIAREAELARLRADAKRLDKLEEWVKSLGEQRLELLDLDGSNLGYGLCDGATLREAIDAAMAANDEVLASDRHGVPHLWTPECELEGDEFAKKCEPLNQPRRMRASVCPRIGEITCGHAIEHDERDERDEDGEEWYYQDTCAYHKCQPVPEPQLNCEAESLTSDSVVKGSLTTDTGAWVCVYDPEGLAALVNGKQHDHVRVLSLPTAEELGRIGREAYDQAQLSCAESLTEWDTICGNAILRGLGVETWVVSE